jgi:hypothetical protein
VPKASDDQSTKQEKDNVDPAAAHGEDTGKHSPHSIAARYATDSSLIGGKPHATEVEGPGAKADKVVDL